VAQVSLDGLDQRGDQVGAALVVALDLRPGRVDRLALRDQAVVQPQGGAERQYGEDHERQHDPDGARTARLLQRAWAWAWTFHGVHWLRPPVAIP
jgi:hypothetical protein